MNEKYIKEVMKYINVSRKNKKRIKEDLEQRLQDALYDNPYFNPYNDLGSPKEYAEEFMDNIEESHIFIQSSTGQPYEYISPKTLFGLPVIHINTGGSNRRPRKAKGIIAIGDIAQGFVAIGGISFGLVSLGGISFGLVGVGGIAFGLASVGGVSIGLVAVGGVAYALSHAFGGIINILK